VIDLEQIYKKFALKPIYGLSRNFTKFSKFGFKSTFELRANLRKVMKFSLKTSGGEP
jgi:hypothetical protein